MSYREAGGIDMFFDLPGPECDGRIDDHDDAMLAHCSRMLVLGDYSSGVYAG